MAANDPLNHDLSGRVCIVTGASAGIGKEIARNLARMKARVILAVRDAGRGEAARAEILGSTGSDAIDVQLVDLSSIASMRAFETRVSTKYPKVDVLVNNAGGWHDDRKITADGHELTWATNVLAYHLMATLLLPALRASGRGRILNVASSMAGKLDTTDLNWDRRPYAGLDAYSQSKQANRMLTWALAEKVAGTGVTVNALHPGWIYSDFNDRAKGVRGFLIRNATRLFGGTVVQGADTATWLASAPEMEGVNGKLWKSRKEQVCEFREPAAAYRGLWEIVEMATRAG